METNQEPDIQQSEQEQSDRSVRKAFIIGALLALIPGVLWGLSGVFGQFLFQQRGMSPQWLVTVRLLTSGLLMLLICLTNNRKMTFAIFRNKKATGQLIIFAIFGMMAVQLTYFVSIEQSNAPTATILQYLFPILVVAVTAIQQKRLPYPLELTAVILAIAGTFLLVTHGNIHTLSISSTALAWGLISAVAMAFYTMYPGHLQKQWTSSVVVGWSMLIGGLCLNIAYPFWQFSGTMDSQALLYLLFIVIFATFISFYLYLVSITMIGATYASLFACIEPLASAFFSVLWLDLQFTFMDYLGSAMILLMMFILAFPRKNI